MFSKTEWDAVMLMRDDLMRHFKLMSSDEDSNIRRIHREMHDGCFEK